MPRPNKGPEVKKRKDTGLWGVCEFRNGNRYWHASGLGSQQEAQEELGLLLTQKALDKCRDLENISVGEIMKYYMDNHIPHIVSKDKALSRHDVLTPFWAPLRGSDVNKAACQLFHKKMNERRLKEEGKTYSDDTIRTYIDHIEAAFNYANDNDKISRVPKFWKPRKPDPEKKFYTHKEVARLLNAASKGDASDYLPLFILMAVYTGVRKSAILKLRWVNVDFKHDEIDFTFARTSRNKGYGVVPIPSKLKRELLKAKKRGTDMGYVLHINQEPIGDIKKSFATAKKRAGVEGTMKDLRKTHGSWLKQKGISSGFIAQNLSHSSTITTDRVYAHLDEGYKKVIKEAF